MDELFIGEEFPFEDTFEHEQELMEFVEYISSDYSEDQEFYH